MQPPRNEAELHTMRDGHTVQAVTVDDLRIGDYVRFGPSSRGRYYRISAIREAPKTRLITVASGGVFGPDHSWRSRRSRKLFIAPRRVYEAQLFHDDGSEAYVAESTMKPAQEQAREWILSNLDPARALSYGHVVAGEMKGHGIEREFVMDSDAEVERVPPRD